MRVLVTGAEGMLGRRLCESAAARGHVVLAYDRPELELDRPDEAAALLREARPEAVVHAAAMTDVDGSEGREADAMRRNGEASGALAAAAAELGAAFLMVSSDYVFDGRGGAPYGEDDPPSPLGAYGRSKRRGEEGTLAAGGAVARLSWSFGPDGKNFVATIAARLRAGDDLRVVDDQRGRPTYTRDAAPVLLDLAAARAKGVWHVCNEGEATWFELARAVARGLGLSAARVAPCATADYPRPAPRPPDSRLATGRLAAWRGPLPHWTDALRRYLEEEGWLAT